MKNIKIALIDSGINANFLKKCEITNVNLGSFDSFHDDIFHGTVCAYLISEIINEGEIYNLKIFDKNIHTNSRKLLKAISWCIENNINIINISVSIADVNYYYEFRDICDLAFEKGCIIIAAASNVGLFSLPAYLQHVCGVGAAQVPPNQFIYKENSPIQYYANGINPFSSENNIFHHSSFATARVAGFLCNFMRKKSLEGKDILNEFNTLASPLNKDLLRVNYKIFDFVSNTSPVIINRDKINDLLLGMKKVFLGTSKECCLLRKHNTVITFDHIISISEISDRETSIMKDDSITFIIGKIPESILNKAKYLNENASTYSLFPIKEDNENRIKYLFDDSTWLNSFIENINKDHIFLNQKLNLLLLNFTCSDLLTLELFLTNLIGEQNTALISNNPLSILFGHDFIKKDIIHFSYLTTYIRSLVETYNQEKKQCIIMSTDSPYKVQNKNFEKDFITFTSLLFSFSPDKVIVTIDKFTIENNLEQTLRYMKGFINAPIIMVIYIDFDVFFDYNLNEIERIDEKIDEKIAGIKHIDTIKESTTKKIHEIFKKNNWTIPLIVNFSDKEQMQKIKFYIYSKI